jgi:hypothetical protein
MVSTRGRVLHSHIESNIEQTRQKGGLYMTLRRSTSNYKHYCGLLLIILCLFLVPSTPILGEDLDVIEDPKPTHIAKEFLILTPVKEIRDIDKHQFLARPHSLVVDEIGAIYIYDQALKKIMKLNREYKWVRNFGGQGQGPGEFSGNDWGSKKIYYSPNGHLYVIAPYNRKLIVFNKKGKHIKDIRLPNKLKARSFLPLVDKKGNMYSISMNEGAVDVYDKDMELNHVFLDKDNYKRFIFYPVINNSPGSSFGPRNPSMTNTYYDILPGGELIIILTFSSRAYIFKNKKMINHFDFWPKSVLEIYKKIMAKEIEKRRNGSTGHTNLIYNLIPDQDDPGHFYLQMFPGLYLYKLNLDGELIHALKVFGGNFRVAAKRHGLFYGFSYRNEYVRIFKIKKEKKK